MTEKNLPEHPHLDDKKIEKQKLDGFNFVSQTPKLIKHYYSQNYN
jgi:hypothetical protein